jgi:hypothetical protein
VVPVTLAAYWVYSNTVSYDPTQTEPTLSIELSAGRQVTLQLSGVNTGANVIFGTTTTTDKATDATFTPLDSDIADATGIATVEIMLPNDDPVYFSARVDNTEVT